MKPTTETFPPMSFFNRLSYTLYYIPVLLLALSFLAVVPVLLAVGFFFPTAAMFALRALTEFFEQKQAEIVAARMRLSRKEET